MENFHPLTDDQINNLEANKWSVSYVGGHMGLSLKIQSRKDDSYATGYAAICVAKHYTDDVYASDELSQKIRELKKELLTTKANALRWKERYKRAFRRAELRFMRILELRDEKESA